jgi:alpha-D-glucose phosphate-specific phosphoglucomutase
MTTNPIKFGTDGWRAIIAREFTFDNVRVCAQAVADYLKETGQAGHGLVIGYDTRFASEDFAAAAAEVVAGNGIKVYLTTGAAPTPVVSYGVIQRRAAGAIIITASHNPGSYNGFKYKTGDGASAPTEVIDKLQENVNGTFASGKIGRLPLEAALSGNKVEYLDIMPAYLEQVGRLVDLNRLRQAGLSVIADPMYGAGIGYFKTVLAGGKIKIAEINGARNPLFPGIHPEPIAVNLKKLSATIKRRRASVGLATDGDADRIGVVAEDGVFLTQLQVFALLCLYLLEVRGERGAIVKTTTSSSMLYRLGEIFNVPVFETPVGFKYVAPVMMAQNALIGGEESGGYGFRGHVPERDGVVAGLYFLDMMVRTGKTPSQLLKYLFSKVGEHYYDRIDMEFAAASRGAIEKHIGDHLPASVGGVRVTKSDATDGYRIILADNSWLLWRFSGTEPLLRIYAESNSPARVKELLQTGRALTGV